MWIKSDYLEEFFINSAKFLRRVFLWVNSCESGSSMSVFFMSIYIYNYIINYFFNSILFSFPSPLT